MKKNFFIILSVILFLCITIWIWVSGTYNQLIILNENIKSQWGQIENSYQRRSDLIPNLVKTIQGSAKFERGTLTDIVQARAKATSITIDPNNLNQEQINKFQNIQHSLNNTLSRLLVSIEKYPDLKTTQNFSELQSQIEGTENRINIERNRFNEAVKIFNQYRNEFPKIFIANFFSKFSEKGYFKSQIGAEKAPVINFED